MSKTDPEPRKEPEVGQTFHHLTVREVVRRRGKGRTQFVCDCACGTKGKTIIANEVRRGSTKSCGCHRTNAMREGRRKTAPLHGNRQATNEDIDDFLGGPS